MRTFLSLEYNAFYRFILSDLKNGIITKKDINKNRNIKERTVNVSPSRHIILYYYYASIFFHTYISMKLYDKMQKL